MGRPKQHLLVGGEPLLVRSARIVSTAVPGPGVVVLGCGAESLRGAMDVRALRSVVNPDWDNGIGTSIRTGLATLLADAPFLEGVLIAVADQPHLSVSRLTEMVERFSGADSIVSARYNGTLGSPVVFGKTFYPELLALDDTQGAQRLLTRHPGSVIPVDAAELAVDLDTPDDYQRWLRENTPADQ